MSITVKSDSKHITNIDINANKNEKIQKKYDGVIKNVTIQNIQWEVLPHRVNNRNQTASVT
jgi:hypothetical protein